MRLRFLCVGSMLLVGCGRNPVRGNLSDAGSSGGGGGGVGGGGGGSSQDAAPMGGSGGGAIDCSNVGCSVPPPCGPNGEPMCTAPCGCCSCNEGDMQGSLVCRGGCWAAPDAGAETGS